MKYLFTPILLAAALAAPTLSFAGDDELRFKHHHVKKLDKIVELTDTQKNQITELQTMATPPEWRHMKHRKLMHEIAQLDPSASDYQADLEAIANTVADHARQRVYIMAERSQEIRAILTEEQLAKLKAFHAKKHEKHQHL